VRTEDNEIDQIWSDMTRSLSTQSLRLQTPRVSSTLPTQPAVQNEVLQLLHQLSCGAVKMTSPPDRYAQYQWTGSLARCVHDCHVAIQDVRNERGNTTWKFIRKKKMTGWQGQVLTLQGIQNTYGNNWR
jgi:hypothetical protein